MIWRVRFAGCYFPSLQDIGLFAVTVAECTEDENDDEDEGDFKFRNLNLILIVLIWMCLRSARRL